MQTRRYWPIVFRTMPSSELSALMIRDAEVGDLPAILAIHNDAVLDTTAIWDERTVDLTDRQKWLDGRRTQGYPVLVCTDGNSLLGYASFGDFRAWSGYRQTVEHSVYVASAHRRRGVARALLEELAGRAATLGKHVMIGGIEASNKASLALHEELGFERAGELRQVGAKFGRWLDLIFVQRFLDDRAEPS